ncbi:MAG: Flp family type IVb pilin [Hyphomonadaceae bacterium]|nr:Flp family type IVb pilin [Hyphomonadaceae bacterium]
MIARFLSDRRGHTAIEYGMIAALCCILIIAALAAMGTSVQGMFGAAANAFTGS